jgi:chaperonin cofactor prefoldin
MVPQNEGGAYQTGGYDPNAYDSSGQIMNASIEGFSKTIGAALGSVTKSDVNKMNVKDNERRNKRIENIDNKISRETSRMTDNGIAEVGTKKSKKLEERKDRIQNRINKTDKEIKEYESVYGKNSTSNDFINKQRKS